MTGGLLQIVSYGVHDIYLIGNPQITFFKMVYRRHTNFAMEYLEEPLYGTQNFGNDLHCILSKTGDLLHKLYLKIAIPQVAIDKAMYASATTFTDSYTPIKSIYDNIQTFLNFANYKLVQPLYKMLSVSNLTYFEINSAYQMLIKNINYNGEFAKISDSIISFFKTFRVPLSKSIDPRSNIIYINDSVNISEFLNFTTYYNFYIKDEPSVVDIFSFLLNGYLLQMKTIKENLFEVLSFGKKLYDEDTRENINFAWVEYLGHQLLKGIAIWIGGKKIDVSDSLFMNIRYQLSNKIMHDLTIKKLIGDVEELTSFDPITKPPYILYIPIDFWFTKYSGLSLPLIYLRFHDVRIELELEDLVNCCYYEKLKDDVVIEDLIKLDSVTLIANYIYLDTDERQKFAQLSQEYLIDQLQRLTFDGIQNDRFDIELPFFNPVKQLFWVARDNDNIARLKYFEYSTSFYTDIYEFNRLLYPETLQKLQVKIRTVNTNVSDFINVGDTIKIINSIYYSGSYTVMKIDNEFIYVNYPSYIYESYKYNYDTSIVDNKITYSKSSTYMGNSQAFIYKENNGNPIISTTLNLNGIQRFNGIDGIYSNFVQPYECNSKAPSYGINTYSFALTPEEYQPSGFCNFNRIELKVLSVLLDDTFINKNMNKTLAISIFAHSYNILKFSYGKAGIILNI